MRLSEAYCTMHDDHNVLLHGAYSTEGSTLTTTLPAARIDMMRSYALGTSSKAKTESTIPLTLPARGCQRGEDTTTDFRTICNILREVHEGLAFKFDHNHPAS